MEIELRKEMTIRNLVDLEDEISKAMDGMDKAGFMADDIIDSYSELSDLKQDELWKFKTAYNRDSTKIEIVSDYIFKAYNDLLKLKTAILEARRDLMNGERSDSVPLLNIRMMTDDEWEKLTDEQEREHPGIQEWARKFIEGENKR